MLPKTKGSSLSAGNMYSSIFRLMGTQCGCSSDAHKESQALWQERRITWTALAFLLTFHCPMVHVPHSPPEFWMLNTRGVYDLGILEIVWTKDLSLVSS